MDIIELGMDRIFVASGVINLWVAYSFSENTWVNFKLFGMLGAYSGICRVAGHLDVPRS